MTLIKRTYALSGDILESFEKKVPPGERSALIASLMRAWLDQQRRDQLRQQVVAGCREMADLYLEIEREYHPLEEEVHRALDKQPKTRRRRARKAGSRPGV